MKFKELISSDYFKLFVKREGKVVLGKRLSSLWLLSGVLTATFLAIAFSNASLDYLSYKMNDPFINWVDIQNNGGGNDFVGFEEFLKDEERQKEYHFGGYQTDKYYFNTFFTLNDDTFGLKCRYFAEIDTPLVQAILSDDNVISGCRAVDSVLVSNSYGVIITHEALYNKLGYVKEIPPYVYLQAFCDPEAEYDFHVDVYNEHFAKIPVPVLAVVKRLPTNMDIIGTKHFYIQWQSFAFNLNESAYASSVVYYLPEKMNAEKFRKDIEEIASGLTYNQVYTMEKSLPQMTGYKGGNFVGLYYDCYDDEIDYAETREIHDAIMAKYQKEGIVRIYEYLDKYPFEDFDDYISVHFKDLDNIVAFQEHAKEEFQIDIEMSQINAKENFNEVSIMANILSWTMIIFAIICIILFIVNLLQSYFQKVKRNLGTFKAFGISNYELISVYVLIMMAMILVSIVLSFFVTWLIQGILPLLGLVKEGTFGYLSLLSGKTFGAILIIIVASVVTVYTVMKKLLKATPGDLIYDR